VNEPRTSAAAPVVLEGEPNGSARIIATVLNEKLAEAPWKVKALGTIGRTVVCIETVDRSEKTMIHKRPNGFAICSDEPKAHVTIQLPMKLIPKVLKIPQGPMHLPALWTGGGLDLTKLLLKRKIVVKGLFLHPHAALRVLQVLAVPPAPPKK
jgi:hypothetical protein